MASYSSEEIIQISKKILKGSDIVCVSRVVYAHLPGLFQHSINHTVNRYAYTKEPIVMVLNASQDLDYNSTEKMVAYIVRDRHNAYIHVYAPNESENTGQIAARLIGAYQARHPYLNIEIETVALNSARTESSDLALTFFTLEQLVQLQLFDSGQNIQDSLNSFDNHVTDITHTYTIYGENYSMYLSGNAPSINFSFDRGVQLVNNVIDENIQLYDTNEGASSFFEVTYPLTPNGNNEHVSHDDEDTYIVIDEVETDNCIIEPEEVKELQNHGELQFITDGNNDHVSHDDEDDYIVIDEVETNNCIIEPEEVKELQNHGGLQFITINLDGSIA